MDSISIVSGVIGSDVHVIGNKLINRVLSQAGYNIVELGVLVSQEEFIQAAIETNARVILISSMYGHAELDCKGLREKCIESGLEDVLLYIGGNLVIGRQNWSEVERKFKKMGFNRVAAPGISFDEILQMLAEDLGLEGK